MVRCIGCAADGAVDVLGGAVKVLVPRDPELPPPPMRASADDMAIITGNANDRATAIALKKPRVRWVNFMVNPLWSPAGGYANKMGTVAQM
jgi:hypothetical protein